MELGKVVVDGECMRGFEETGKPCKHRAERPRQAFLAAVNESSSALRAAYSTGLTR